jgi:hypothetical protein
MLGEPPHSYRRGGKAATTKGVAPASSQGKLLLPQGQMEAHAREDGSTRKGRWRTCVVQLCRL